MKITASPRSRSTGNIWDVTDLVVDKTSMQPDGDGGVQITLLTNHLKLTGEFRMKVALSAAEVEALSRLFMVGPAEARIAKLEKELKKLSAVHLSSA